MKGLIMGRLVALAMVLLIGLATVHGHEGRHLFILSGQSNMVGMDPQVSFTPTVAKS